MSSSIASVAQIQDDFDCLAALMTDEWDHNGHYHAFLLNQLPARLGEVLEIGSGTGAFARQLARRARHVLALDLSPAMVDIARERSAGLDNITYQVADVLRWDWPMGQFDCIVCIATLHHLPLAETLAQIRDALAPGGILIALDLFEVDGILDRVLDVPAAGLAAVLRLAKNHRLRDPSEVRAAWAAHAVHDASLYLTLNQLRQICGRVLPGARLRRHLLWRYSLVWRKETGGSR